LESGTTVIADRYAFSGVAFSASKNASGLTYEWCRSPEIGLPAPDLTIFLDIQPEKARERGGYGEERYEKEEVQRRVRGVFERIGREMDVDRWRRVDAGNDVDSVQKVIWEVVEPLVDGIEGPVKKLWLAP
jgi:dTMP kinase